MEMMRTPHGAAADFERKLGEELRKLVQNSIDMWSPYVSNDHIINITLSSVAFCGAAIARAVNAPDGTFAEYAKTAEEVLADKRTL
jgi:hypothetical protein